jgi:O-antigen ligase
VILWAFVLALAWLPLWFGSNLLDAWAINAALFPALAAVYQVRLLVSGKSLPVSLGQLWLPVLLFGAVVVWTVLQCVSWTPEAWHHPVWLMARDALGGSLPGAVSVKTDATALALIRLLTGAAVFWLAVQLGHDRANARFCLYALAVIGAVYGGYGLIARILLPDTILWFEKLYYKDSVTSTFINRNSFATYAGLTWIVVVALFIREIEKAGQGRTWKDRLETFITGTLGNGLRLLLAFLVIVLALLLTGSRAGITASLAGLLSLLAVAAMRSCSNKVVVAGWAMISLGTVTALIAIFGEFYIDRLELASSQFDDRLNAYAVTWRAILDRPWLGTGYGTFADIFPMYRDATNGLGGVWDKAHNTYLEAVLGLGLVAGTVLIVLVVTLVIQSLAAARHNRGYTPASMAAVATTILVGLHALVDFSLQIQAVALTYGALLGLGVSQNYRPKAGHTSKGR